ncbi:MAG: hypothetical protein KBA38_06860 [Negativicutes bacterium]|nr:hypothetical protein [Negativicutes bacterium]
MGNQSVGAFQGSNRLRVEIEGYCSILGRIGAMK